ncbi:MAG: MFS transporter [Sphingobacteriales bacterium]|nr:MFS transporter [Sphingobacteriales bacterium]
MKNEKFILYLLTFIWFCAIVDFLLMLPLGTELMHLYHIQPREYSMLIFAFSLSGGISAFMAAFYIDRYDRKTVLLTAFFFFAIGSILCSFAHTYHLMLFARFFTGLFGGLLGGVSTAYISDMVPYERRGKAMGILNLGFGLASIVGIPFAIFICEHMDVFWPFRVIGILSLVTLIPAIYYLPEMRDHIPPDNNSIQDIALAIFSLAAYPFVYYLSRAARYRLKVNISKIAEVLRVLKDKNLQNALLFGFFLVLGHFMFISFINPYLVGNLGFKLEDTKWMYIVGGISVSLTSPTIGKFIDTLGKLKSFRILILLSFIPILVISHIHEASIMMALLICAFMFIFNSGRMIAAQTLITGAPTEEQRGKFLVIGSSLIEMSEGFSALIGGLILTKDEVTGHLNNYNYIAYIAVLIGILCIYLASRIEVNAE